MKLLIVTHIIAMTVGTIVGFLISNKLKKSFNMSLWNKIWFFVSTIIRILFYWLKVNFRLIWFIFIFTGVFIYCKNNWNDIVIFDIHNSSCILFCYLIIISVFPFVSDIELPWFKSKVNDFVESDISRKKLDETMEGVKEKNVENKIEDALEKISKQLGDAEKSLENL